MMNTKKLKFRIYGFEVRCAWIIAQGITDGKDKKFIFRRLKREIIWFSKINGLIDSEINYLWQECCVMYRSIVIKVWGNRTDNRRVYLAVKALLLRIDKVKNILSRVIESRMKQSYLDNLISDGIFYLCSHHTNCADGHREYQGKIYVSSDWINRCDSADRNKIQAYIRNHCCMTVEDVIGAPVWMVNRPNCGHFFKRIDTEVVLHSSVNRLLDDYNMKRVDCDERPHEYLMYRFYYERLKMLLSLREICGCDALEKDIKDTRRLIRKMATRST